LKRAFLLQDIPFPRKEQRLPLILSGEDVAKILTVPPHLKSRDLLMTIYAAGLRRSEVAFASQRHRLGTHEHRHPSGQRTKGSSGDVIPGFAGDLAAVLEIRET
jgi:site-specific recombinase XerC